MSKNNISVRNGVSWLGLSKVVSIVLQLIAMLVLARLLPPADFGLMALAATVTAFASLFRDFGTGSALIQRKAVDKDLKDAVFWVNVFIGTFLSMLLALLAYPLSLVFAEPRIFLVLIVLSPVFFIMSLSIVHKSLLERFSRFKTTSNIEIISGILTLMLTILAALNGWGVYALVVQVVANGILTGIFYWCFNRWRPRFKLDFTPLKNVWGFSSNIFVFNIVNYFQRNADSVLIGRFLGSADLGFYNMAYRILLFPLQSITFVVNRASYPIYSRNQDNRVDIVNHYLSTLSTIAFFTAPMMAFVWSAREVFIEVLLGGNWLPSSTVLAWLAPVGFVQSLVSTSGTILNSIGRSDLLRNLGFLSIPFLVFPVALALPWGVVGVAAAYCMGNLVWVYPVIRTVLKQFDTGFSSFLKVVYRQAMAACVAAFIVVLLLRVVPLDNFSALICFIMLGIVYVVAFFSICFLICRSILFSNLRLLVGKQSKQTTY